MGQASDTKKGLHKLKILKCPCDYLITVSTFTTCVAFYPVRLRESDRTLEKFSSYMRLKLLDV